jgi:hypothetical protein
VKINELSSNAYGAHGLEARANGTENGAASEVDVKILQKQVNGHEVLAGSAPVPADRWNGPQEG